MPKMHRCARSSCLNECPAKNKYCSPECLALAKREQSPNARVMSDLERKQFQDEIASLKKLYAESQRIIKEQEKQLGALDEIGQGVETFHIEPYHGTNTSEATAVMVASDWHVEEHVKPGSVSNLNTFTLDIAKERATKFFQRGHRLLRLLQQDVKIDNLVLPLLGDFISNDIHEEFPENNQLTPVRAILEAQSYIESGFDFLLNNSNVNLIVPCHSGNHARTTRTTRFGDENGHSLEYMMYRHLAAKYASAGDRVTFIIPEGYHSYLDIYDLTVRFHHGHAIKYAGGVGGIFIPAYKAIAQWNKARHADLDVFGHFHQTKDGGNFICNGSLIGYNSFALSIKADFEPPRQSLFLIDKKRGRTCNWPILL